MEVDTGETKLRLAPIAREEVGSFVAENAQWGMQSYEVAKYLGTARAQSPQSEENWWDKVDASDEDIVWGIYVSQVDDGWKLVGNTALRWRSLHQTRRMESGCLIFDRAAWNKGVASAAHLARTRYAFEVLDLLAVDSAAATANTGSNKALQRIGYVKRGITCGMDMVEGKPVDLQFYTLVNPSRTAWNYFWRRPKAEIPPEYHEGRILAMQALDRARQYVTFL